MTSKQEPTWRAQAPSIRTLAAAGVASALLFVAGACAAAAPEGAHSDGPPADWHRSIQWPDSAYENPGRPSLKVLPVGSDGQPIRARSAVVYRGGSNSSTCEGPRVLNGPPSGTATLTVTTEDGLIAWRTVTPTEEPLRVKVTEPGAFLEVELARDEDARIAIFHGGARIHDVTLRPGKKATFVVPSGEVQFGLTEPGGGRAPRTASFSPGERTFVQLN